jgi:enoyl-CoA hydratase/carnithine racemase
MHRVRLVKEKHIARLNISPVLDAATLAELAHLLEAWNPPPALKALVLDLSACAGSPGLPHAESVGGKGLLEGRQGRVRERALNIAQERVLASLNRLSVPILGVAAGVIPPSGCVLLAACDLMLASEQTSFVREGGAGLAYRVVPTRSGATGAIPERISAQQAYRQGIVNWLAPHGQLAAETERILALLLDKSAIALSLAKRAFLLGLSQAKEPDKALEGISTLYLQELMATSDALEGLHAFLEKRSPVWQDSKLVSETQRSSGS